VAVIAQLFQQGLAPGGVAVMDGQRGHACVHQRMGNGAACAARAHQERPCAFQGAAQLAQTRHVALAVQRIAMPACPVLISAQHVGRTDGAGAVGQRGAGIPRGKLVRYGHDNAVHILHAGDCRQPAGKVFRRHVRGHDNAVRTPIAQGAGHPRRGFDLGNRIANDKEHSGCAAVGVKHGMA